MNHIKYENLNISSDVLEFRFISEGRNGQIAKIVQYYQIAPNVYNLALGDEKENGELDDLCSSNNGDIVKVLATVAFTIYAFTNSYPDMVVYLTGNTPVKTRVYRRAIVNNWEEINKDFTIYGQVKREDGTFENEVFNENNEYTGFFIVKRTN